MKKAMALMIAFFCLVMTVVFANPNVPEDAKSKLDDIEQTERATIEKLFVLNAEIEYLNTQMEKVQMTLQRLSQEMIDTEIRIEENQERIVFQKDVLAKLLVSRHQKGIAANVQVLLESTSLKDFMRRLNLLREMTQQTDQFLKGIEDLISQQQTDYAFIEDAYERVKVEEATLRELLQASQSARDDLEAFLEGLSEDRSYYESYLISIEKEWVSLKLFFADVVKTFNQVILNNELPEDTIEVKISFLNATGYLDANVFNTVLKNHGGFPHMLFSFDTSGVTLNFPEQRVVLGGDFELIDSQTIAFAVTSGTFYGLPLSDSALADLLSEGSLVFELKDLLGKNVIRSIEMQPNKVKLNITIRLF